MTPWYPRWYRTSETPFAHSLDSALARELHHAALLHSDPNSRDEIDLPRVLHAADVATTVVVGPGSGGGPGSWADVTALTEALEHLLAASATQRAKANAGSSSTIEAQQFHHHHHRNSTTTASMPTSSTCDHWIETWTRTLSCGSRPTTPLCPPPGGPSNSSPRSPPSDSGFSRAARGVEGGVMGAIRYWTMAATSTAAFSTTAAAASTSHADDVAHALQAPTPGHLALVWLSVLLAARRVAVAHARALLPLHSALQLCLAYWQWTLDHPYCATAYELLSLRRSTWSHLWFGGVGGYSAAVRDRISKVTELRLMEKSVVRQIGRLFQSLELLQRSLRFLNVQRMMEEGEAVVGFVTPPAAAAAASAGDPGVTAWQATSPAAVAPPGQSADGATEKNMGNRREEVRGDEGATGSPPPTQDDAAPRSPPRAATPPSVAALAAARSGGGDDDPQPGDEFAADVASAVILAVRKMIPRSHRSFARGFRQGKLREADAAGGGGGGITAADRVDDGMLDGSPLGAEEEDAAAADAGVTSSSKLHRRMGGEGTRTFASVPRVFSMTALHPDATASSFFRFHDDAVDGGDDRSINLGPAGNAVAAASAASSPESALRVVCTLTSLSRSTGAWVEKWRDLAVSRYTPPIGRHWRRIALATCITLPLLRAFFTVSSQDLQQRAQAAVTWIEYFLRWYVVGPALNLHRALFAPRVGVQERQEALRREVESMAQIIEDYHRDFALRAQALSSIPSDLLEVHHPNAREGDYGLIQQHLEEAIRHPIRGFFFGNLVRLSLIHVQKLKLDVSRVLTSFDEVLEANDVNFRVMALGPFVLCSVLMVSYVVFRKKEKRRPAFVKLRLLWRTLHRLLSLSGDDEVHRHHHQHQHHHHHHHHYNNNSRPSSPSGRHRVGKDTCPSADNGGDNDEIAERDDDGMRTTNSGGSGASGMTDEDQGRVALTVHQMRGLKEFLEDYQLMHEFLEDLDDLDMPHLTRGQRLRVLDRMHAVHHFLDANAH